MTSTTPQDIYDFWFVEIDKALWFRKDPAFDTTIRNRFAPAIAAAREGRLDHWAETPRTCLSLIVAIDQFSRNVFRLSPLAWSADPRALALSKATVARHYDAGLSPDERKFLYMPLMHSEALADQQRCVDLFSRLNEEDPAGSARSYEAALQHRDIIARFGRFPHRNAVLRRPSSAAEIAFLLEENSSF